MSTASTPDHTGSNPAEALFARVICGVDGTPEGGEGVAQVARLAPPGSSVVLCSAWNAGSSVVLGWSPPVSHTDSFPQAEIKAAIGAARPLLPDELDVDTTIVQGPPGPMLLTEIERRRATLVAVGSHGHHRVPGIVLGSVATQLLHESPCAVLVARAPGEREGFPRTIMVGADGSSESERAVQVAKAIADRLGAELEAIVATAGGETDLPAVRSTVEAVGAGRIALREEHDSAVAALKGLRPDLLVVGSRGLRGLRALGSVSERVAHEAECSVLVVR
jgi:nucleotide-binding universal stress UspA family protein